MNVGRIATRGALVTVVGQLLQLVAQVVGLSVLGRLLTPDEYGIYAMVIAIVGVAAVLGDFGLSMAAIQAKELSRAQSNNLFWINSALGFVLAITIVALSGPIASFYGQPEVTAVTRVVAITFLVASVSAQFRAHMARELRFRAMALIDVSGQCVGVIAAVVIAISGGGYWALVAQQVVAAGVVAAGLIGFAGWWPGLPMRRANMRSLLSFGANSSGVQLLVYVTSNVDNVALGRTADVATVGLYNRAYQLFRLPLQQIAAPLTRVALPLLSRADDAAFARYIARSQLVLVYVFGGAFLALAALADPVVAIVLGGQWDGAVPIFVVLAVGGVFQAMGYVYYWTYTARGLTGLQLRMTLITRGLMTAAILVGLAWGPLGVAAGASVGQLVSWLLNTYVAMPRVGVATGPLIRAAVRPILTGTVVACVGAATVYALASSNAWVQLITGLGVMFATFAVVLAVSAGARRDMAVLIETARMVRK